MPSFWNKIRADFPLTKKYTYLDHAAGGPIPEPVTRSIHTMCNENARHGDFAWEIWMARRDKARRTVARFIGASPEEVTFTHSTSHGMNLIADLLATKGTVLTNTAEFPTSTLPWIWRCVPMKYQKPKKNRLPVAELKSLLSPKVKTILTSFVQYGSGYRQDLRTLGKIKGNRFLVVNATQGFGALPVDVKKWNADFLCANSYKWLMAGYGGGILYVRKKWLSKLKPLSVGWRSMKDPDSMNNRKIDLMAQAARYEPGCPSFPTIFAVSAAVEYLSQIGMKRIENRILDLTDHTIEKLEKNDFEVLSPKERKYRSGIVIFKASETDRLWRSMIREKIFISQRGGGLRIAPHFYNSFEEIDRCIRKLVQLRKRQGRKR